MFGRRDIIHLKFRTLRAAGAALAGIGNALAGLRPVRWMASKRGVRVFAAICIICYLAFMRYFWRPFWHGVRRARRYLGRHEVWAHLLTWLVCAVLGFVLAITWRYVNFTVMKILLAILVAGGLMAVCIRSPLGGLLFYLVVSPIARTLIHVKIAEGTPVLTLEYLVFPMLLMIYAVQKKPEELESTRALHWCMALFMIGELVAGLRTEIPRSTVQMVLTQYWFPILAYLFARRWVRTRRQFSIFIVMIVIVGVYFVAVAVPEHLTGRNYFTYTGYASNIEWELGTVRAQGAARSPQEFGLTLTLVVCIALVRITEVTRGRRFLFGLLIVALMAGMAYTLRRSVYAGLMIALVTMLVATPRPRKAAAVAIACCVLGVAVGWGSLVKSDVYKSRIGQRQPILQRYALHATAWNIVKHHPWFGLGFNGYAEGNRKYLVGYGDIMPRYARGFDSPHSSYWRIMVDGGLVTFLPFSLAVVLMLLTTIRMYRRVRDPGLLGRDGIVVFMAFSVAVLAQAGTTDSFYFQAYLILLIYMFFGALVGIHLQKQPAESVTDEAARDLSPLYRRAQSPAT